MNWLAHVLLSKKDAEYQIGNFLADPLKGRPWADASIAVKEGMLMHKAIDKFTDTHAIVAQSKSRLGKGYLKGVVLDLLYDHFLAINWDKYSSLSQAEFLQTFYTNAQPIAQGYPTEAKRIVINLITSNILSSYGEFEGFVESLKRIDKRLSPRVKEKESTISYKGIIEQEYENLKSDFELFFPELMHFFKQHELGCKHQHFLMNDI